VINAVSGFILGIIFSRGLVQFDFNLSGLRSYAAPNQRKVINIQRSQIQKTNALLEKQRQNLFIKSLKKTGKKAAGSLVPVLGTALTIGLAAKDYCDDVNCWLGGRNRKR